MTKEISVIIPVYNGEKYLIHAMESVLCQKVSCEIIVVDDGSKDRTAELVKPYVDKGEVRYLKNERNMGVAYSRNRGVVESEGDYVAFLDADDYWETGKLECQLKVMKNSQAALCCTARELMTADGVLTGRILDVPERIDYKMLLKHNCIACSSVLMKREIALEFLQEHDDAHEDYIMWLKILKKYPYAIGINKPLLKYRMNPAGKSGSKWNSAKMTYKVYRYMGLNPVQRVRYFISYALHGVFKYMK